MSIESPFNPTSLTTPIAVTTVPSAAVTLSQPAGTSNAGQIGLSYRLLFYSATSPSQCYINWAPPGAPAPTIAAPTLGTPYAGLALLANANATLLSLPPGAQIVAVSTAAGTLEITEGVGH